MTQHLLSIEDLDRDGIVGYLDGAEYMSDVLGREIPKVPALRGKTIVSLFYEDSTRTRLSFETAAKRLSAEMANAGDVNALSAEQWSEFVNRCEAIISDENTSWAAKWTKT